MYLEIDQSVAEQYKNAIFVVELHHQHVGAVWVAMDKSDFVKQNQKEHQYDDNAPSSDDFQAWVEYAGSDLRSLHLLNLEDAVWYCDKLEEGSDKLRRLIQSHGLIRSIDE